MENCIEKNYLEIVLAQIFNTGRWTSIRKNFLTSFYIHELQTQNKQTTFISVNTI